ncbi:MAG: 50S ribosome-binding GTPase [Candidatus Pacebacteria bacterium]|nr:50S ribosome-binding GTPase [Candidatus Paceibacterota bacterium]
MDNEEIEKKIKDIEQQIRKLPYHKATEHHIGKLKAKLAKLRESSFTKSSKGKSGKGYAVRKTGDGTVVLAGFPSVGKSTLLNKLTDADSKVAAYDFTTLDVIPGILNYKGAKIQIFDVPGLIKGASKGKGRGKEVLSVVRIADLLVLMASSENPNSLDLIEKELYLSGVRIDQKKPEVYIDKRLKGGIDISGNIKSLSKKTIKSLAQEFGILNAKIVFKQDINQDEFIDVLIGNRVYVPSLNILSKIDLISEKDFKKILKKGYISISVKKEIGIENLKEKIFEKLDIMRIYLRKDLKSNIEKEPLICKKNITVLQIANKISQELGNEIKGAKIKGPSALHLNQLVGLNHILKDMDQVFFVK